MDGEFQPLLQSFQSRKRSLCRRIPAEITITGIILGLFLVVVVLLIVIENLRSPSDKQLDVVKDLLDTSIQGNKALLGSPLQTKGFFDNVDSNFVKKSKDKDKDKDKDSSRTASPSLDENTDEDNKLENEQNFDLKAILSEEDVDSLLSSKKFKDFTQDLSNLKKQAIREKLILFKWKKELINNFVKDKTTVSPETQDETTETYSSENDFEKNLDKNETEVLIDLLGSPYKFNKKILDDTWQSKKEKFAKSRKNYEWNKNFNVLMQGSSINDKTNSFSSIQQDKKTNFNFIKPSKNYKWDNVDKGWKKLSQTGITPIKGCPYKGFYGPEPDPEIEALMQSYVDCSHLAEEMKKNYGTCIDLSFLPKECKPSWRTKCFSTYKYRKIDGSCNNRIHPTWGMSGVSFIRMMAPDYGDGVSSLRLSTNGDALPNARELSQKLYSEKKKPDLDVSMLFLIFGLFIDHDMVETALNTAAIPCCHDEFLKKPENRPKECVQIDVLPTDPFYGPRNVTCLNLVRSIPVQGECIGRREQLNKATAFLDGSTIYGSTVGKAKALRSFNKGQLKTQRINNTPFMMYSNKEGYSCGTSSEPYRCFESGDSRVNMLVDLTAIHAVWYREHNRVAMELFKLNPAWTDERLYQEARRIIIAEIQHITYNEFLPLLLGEEAMEYFELKVNKNEPYNGYDETINPGVFNVFGAAAFRFGHSLVQDTVALAGSDNSTSDKVLLHETFFNMKLLFTKGLDYILRGAATQKLNSVDSYISKEIREHLFQPTDKDYGLDLAAIGIQRGRDHGLAAYKKWRAVCGLSDIKTWDDLNNIMDPDRVEKLREAYKNLEDIDLIPGALAEEHVEGSLLGPTYLCIIGRQFKKTRLGDRFWYQIQDKIGSLTEDQLQEIYKSSAARIVCDNSDSINQIQKHAFKVLSEKNPLEDCENIPKVDLMKWKE